MGILLNYNDWKKLHEAENGQLSPNELVKIPDANGSATSHKLNPIAAKAYSEMVNAAKADGIEWDITDSYRPLEVQERLVKQKGLYSEGGLAAAPGTSNHGWGSAVDLTVKKGTKEFRWLKRNAKKFGFSTISREPWHWEHTESAKKMKELDSGEHGGVFNIPTIKRGDSGDLVKELQTKLVNLNYTLPIHGIDGKFGPETKAAVEEFQHNNNLEVTGEVDREMASLIISNKAKPFNLANSRKSAGSFSKDIVDFDRIVSQVIDELEGGYFHPKMKEKNPSKFAAYSSSGETMFGLDRHAGHSLYYSTPRKEAGVMTNLKHIEAGEYQYRSPEAKEFWETIDAADAKNKWSWNYRGGTLEPKLKFLAGRIILPEFRRLFDSYISPKAKSIISKDGRLLFHFIYATWNGEGWFKKFASDINAAVEKGVTSPDALLNLAVDSRTGEGLLKNSKPNQLIAQSGSKFEKIVGLA